MAKFLITGANGQIGFALTQRLRIEKGHDILALKHSELDITNKNAVLSLVDSFKPNIIINGAAYTHVDRAETEESLVHDVNVKGLKYLAEAANRVNASILHISTDYVFDGTAHTPYTEDCNPCPDSVYGTTKLEGEKEVMNHCEQAVVIRTAWLYSTFGNNFVKTMIRLGKERDSLGVVFDQIGTPTYANDLARAIYAIINKGIVRGVYHFSNEGVCSWYDFTVAIHRLAGITTCKVKPLHTAEYPAKANRPAYSVLDKTKIKTTFDIEIPHWEESLKQCLIKLGMKNEE